MNKTQWVKINEILAEALDLPSDRRIAYVDKLCGSNQELRREIFELLAAENASSILETESVYELATLSTNSINSPFISKSEIFKNSLMNQIVDNRYQIVEQIGEGGMGYVFRANDLRLTNRAVVVKFLKPEILDEDYLLNKFKQEMEALARIKAEGVIDVYDTGNFNQIPYLVTEYFAGKGLDLYLKDSSISMQIKTEIIKKIGRALAVAHRAGVIHRDLKPTNILVKSSADGVEIKIIDFGIARVNNSVVSAQTTQFGRTLGTVYYMSPEQLYGEANLSPASDVFSLGAIAYEMFTGQRPFNPQTIAQLPEMHRRGVSINPRALNPQIPERLENAVLKALNFQPSERFQTATEFGDEVAQSLDKKVNNVNASLSSEQTDLIDENYHTQESHITIRPEIEEGIEEVPTKSTRGNHLIFAILSGVLLLAVAFGLWITYQLFSPKVPITMANTNLSVNVNSNVLPRTLEEREFSYSLKVQPTEKNREDFIASPLQTFLGGWRFRLQFQSPQDGYLYLLSEGSDEKGRQVLSILYPDPRLNNGQALVNQNQKIETNQYEFAKKAGVEKFWIVWGKFPVSELEEVKKYVNPQNLGAIGDQSKEQDVRNFLQKNQAKLNSQEDAEKKELTIKGNGDVIIQLAELRHN